MNIMIASDLHGSAYYCRLLFEAFEREKADRILLLGDLLYHGPRNDLPKEYAPKEVIDILNKYKNKIICIRGNCDSEVDQMVLEFPIMAENCLLYAGDRLIFATHGHKMNKQNPPLLSDGDVVLYGHTHIPDYSMENGLLFINPGSVSIPKEGSAHSYLTFHDNVFTWKTMDGTVVSKHCL